MGCSGRDKGQSDAEAQVCTEFTGVKPEGGHYTQSVMDSDAAWVAKFKGASFHPPAGRQVQHDNDFISLSAIWFFVPLSRRGG
jgi:hypothetical protein